MDLTLARKFIRFFSRRLPIMSGAGTLTQLPPLSWIRFPEDTLWIDLKNGLKACVMPNDFIGKASYFFGDHDPKVHRALRTVLTPDMTFVDIGANVGTVSLGCAHLVRRIVAIEPQPRCAELLRRSIAANQLQNVEVCELALSQQSGTATMFIADDANLGTVSLSAGGRHDAGVTVRTVNASEFLESLKIDGDYVIKIDVEGYEEPVLRASEPYLRSHLPRAILFECNRYAGEDFFSLPLYHLVSSLGYRIHAVPKSVFRYRTVEVLGSVPRTATDFIALR